MEDTKRLSIEDLESVAGGRNDDDDCRVYCMQCGALIEGHFTKEEAEQFIITRECPVDSGPLAITYEW